MTDRIERPDRKYPHRGHTVTRHDKTRSKHSRTLRRGRRPEGIVIETRWSIDAAWSNGVGFYTLREAKAAIDAHLDRQVPT